MRGSQRGPAGRGQQGSAGHIENNQCARLFAERLDGRALDLEIEREPDSRGSVAWRQQRAPWSVEKTGHLGRHGRGPPRRQIDSAERRAVSVKEMIRAACLALRREDRLLGARAFLEGGIGRDRGREMPFGVVEPVERVLGNAEMEEPGRCRLEQESVRGVPSRRLVAAASQKAEQDRLLAECRRMKEPTARRGEMLVRFIEMVPGKIHDTHRIVDTAGADMKEGGARKKVMSLVEPSFTPRGLGRTHLLSGPGPKGRIDDDACDDETSGPSRRAGSDPSVPLRAAPVPTGHGDFHCDACCTIVRSTGSPRRTLSRSTARAWLQAISRKSDELKSTKGALPDPSP